MLNLITNLSLWLLCIRSLWSIFTLFQLSKAISCNCIKAAVSANHPSSLAWHTEHPLSWNTPACASLGLHIVSCLFFQIPSALRTFTGSWTLATQALGSAHVTSLAALFSPSAAQSFLHLDPVVPDMYSIFVCCHGYSCVKACQWTMVPHLHIYSL